MSASNSMVAHKWAHGNAAKGSNFETDGQRLTSYSTTVGWNTGRGLVFLSASSMNPITGRQLSHARHAASHLDVVYTEYFRYGRNIYQFDESAAFKTACETLTAEREGLSKARSGKYLHASMTHSNEEGMKKLVAIAEQYGFDIPTFTAFSGELVARAAKYAAEYEAKDAERRAAARAREVERAAAQRELDAAQFNRWHAGELVACPSSYRHTEDGSHYIAVRGDKVVTSGGAECPIDHARRGVAFWASRAIEQARPAGIFEPWERNGHRVQLGVLQLDRIDANGTAFAGCHSFSAATLNRLADILL